LFCLQDNGGETDGTDETTHGEGELVTGGTRAGSLGGGAGRGAGRAGAGSAGAAIVGTRAGTGTGTRAGAGARASGSASLSSVDDVRNTERVGSVVVVLCNTRLLAVAVSLVVVGRFGLLRDAFLAHALIQGNNLGRMGERSSAAAGTAIAIVGRAFGEADLLRRRRVGGGRGDGRVGGGGGGAVRGVGDGGEEGGSERVLHFVVGIIKKKLYAFYI